MSDHDLVTKAAMAAYPELFDPTNRAWFQRSAAERAYHTTEILQRIGRAVEVVQADAAPSPTQAESPAVDENGAITLTMLAPDAQIVVATFGVVSFLDSDGTENYAMAHSDGASRATLLGMLAMASHEIVTAPGDPGPVES